MLMRVALCVRHEKTIFRLVWINESRAGIYLGVLGTEQDSHISYHQDGTRHTKIGADHHNRFSDIPISSHVSFKQLDHLSLSLTKNWFNPRTIYNGDEKTEVTVLLDQRLLYGRDTLALDVWMTDRASEQKLLDAIAKHLVTRPDFQVVAEFVFALEYFPNQKIALTLCSSRVRDVDSTQLMFPLKNG